jgi:DNA-binding NarL/FixJ family response regulator
VQEHRRGERSTVLSRRETEVLKLIAEGKSGKEIAAVLHLSIRTIDTHRTNIMKKLNVSKSTDLVRHAISRGYVSS